MSERQVQRAGDNSSQIQVHGDYYAGLSSAQLQEVVERAERVAADTARLVIDQFSEEGQQTGAARVARFDEGIVGELGRSGLLHAFQDPGFQVFLRKAQLHAASTERTSDYELLTSLLVDRAERGEKRQVRAALDRAVEIIDLLDDSALAGLTMMSGLNDWHPAIGLVGVGLDRYDAALGGLMTDPLPTGSEWIDHLEILDCLRVSQVGKMKKMEALFPGWVPGYVAQGIEAGSDREREFRERLLTRRLRLELVDHELKPGYLRLAYARESAFIDSIRPELEEDGRELLRTTVEEFGLFSPDSGLTAALMSEVRKRPNLREIVEWWDAIPGGFSATAVGRVVARANVRRCDAAGVFPPFV